MPRIGRPAPLDLALALGLTAAGEVEVALGADAGALVRALTLPLATLPLAARRSVAPAAPAAVAAVLLVQAAWGSLFDAGPGVLLVALVVALYGGGRYARGAVDLALAACAAAGAAAVRIGFDPEVASPGDALLTVVAVTVPLLAGAWVRGQDRLQLELERAAGERDRARARDARQAAEEERMRIAADLEVAVAGRLSEIARTAPALRDRLGRGDDAAAEAPFADIAAAAREALADVRRVLGILRRAGERAPRAPAAPSASLPVAAAATPAAGTGMDVAPPPRRRVPSAADAALAAAVLVGAEAELALRVPADERLIAALTPLPIAAALLARRARPVPAALALLGAIAVQSLLLRPEFFAVANMAAVCCASYAIGAHTSQRTAAGGGALVALAVAAHALAFHPQGVWIALLAAVAVPWGLGRVIRGQRRATRAAHDRAGAVERRRERDARAAVTAERMRVARELHDAVAHNVSVIAIQAAGAEGLVAAGDPRRAAEIAGLIETVARDALAELGRLRGGVPAGAPPGLAGVRELAERTREGGLPVEVRIEGEPGRLPAGIDLAGFRIVQEALANASKHAGRARARVVVRYEPRAVELEIADDGRAPARERRARAGSGHGLVGMRERVAIYGGTLDAGRRAGGGFTVRARLPLEGA